MWRYITAPWYMISHLYVTRKCISRHNLIISFVVKLRTKNCDISFRDILNITLFCSKFSSKYNNSNTSLFWQCTFYPIPDLYILIIPYNPLRRLVVRYVHNIFLERFRRTFDTCSIQDDNVSSPILSHHLWFFVCRCSTHLEVSTFNKIWNR